MSHAGDLIDQYTDTLSEYFEYPLELRNYVEGSSDEYGDEKRELSADSPIQTEGRIEEPDQPTTAESGYGESTSVDGVVFLPDDVPVHSGTADQPWPTQITDPDTGDTYEAIRARDEKNGLQRVDATYSERRA